ncbi:hypothetical protein [Campylobacter hyointestinalis]|uniref:hypothetical protein n=1 Tax=Campylobacter hyointestinalis TaxID=198 RepID=UPI000DCAF90B|nr:hypothetical protein [Campylobacter hyointestinalis]RAZ26567.1 hypothetical protein CHL9752_00230 [Campylobacter hyointestinalis subsp. lawsonii]RAZ40445.1 hypothetical protein CHL9426_00405 [Campylobacter hyointestinalis subsp. lawsonii]RAZ56820.1 hypothetical protein CHL10074_02180 [Campylobacter hyointestinalis subsp. lawsonii]RAZ64851.1 hypothetical protein CHL9767_02495 [Campylobacter hyointestinalis subsp. lawsonii]
MSRVLWLLLLSFFSLNFSLNAAGPSFEHAKKFELKKDEKAYVFITDRREGIEDIFEFSWTLFDNTNMVLHTKFRKYPRQIVLSLRRGLELYKQVVLPHLRKEIEGEVMLYLEFKDFKNGIGTFMVYIDDDAKRVNVRFEPNVGDE